MPTSKNLNEIQLSVFSPSINKSKYCYCLILASIYFLFFYFSCGRFGWFILHSTFFLIVFFSSLFSPLNDARISFICECTRTQCHYYNFLFWKDDRAHHTPHTVNAICRATMKKKTAHTLRERTNSMDWIRAYPRQSKIRFIRWPTTVALENTRNFYKKKQKTSEISNIKIKTKRRKSKDENNK